MRDFLISVVSFVIITGIIWGTFFLLDVVIGLLSSIGIPAAFSWFTAGLVVAYCQPATAFLRLCESVYFKVHETFWRFD